MLDIQVREYEVRVGERFALSLQRTLRVPEDGKEYPLPPGLGAFPVHKVEDYPDTVPDHWRQRGGVFIPMYQSEAVWLAFTAASWKPNAVKVGVGGINAVSGEQWDDREDWSDPLRTDPQDYIVCPTQPWLDGVNSGEGIVRQFVAMPLGQGYTVEEQLTGQSIFGGIQVVVFEPRPSIFPDTPPEPDFSLGHGMVNESALMEGAAAGEPDLGLAAGGSIRQKIYPDPYDTSIWDTSNYGALYVHIVNSLQYRTITGRQPLPSPISAQTYTDYGFPWFELYDEEHDDLPPSERLRQLKGTAKRTGDADVEYPVEIEPDQVKKLSTKRPKRQSKADGK